MNNIIVKREYPVPVRIGYSLGLLRKFSVSVISVVLGVVATSTVSKGEFDDANFAGISICALGCCIKKSECNCGNKTGSKPFFSTCLISQSVSK